MKYLFYLIALILILSWSIAFVGYGRGGFVHILLVFAIMAAAMEVFLEKRSIHKYQG
jgi:hypothetical protein